MKFQPGQSGNPAGRPPGSLNKKTLAARALLEQETAEIVQTLKDRAKNGDLAALRLCMDRLDPTGRDRPVAIDLPVIKTPEDAELALTVVTDELAAGNLTISDASALVALVDRMLRVAERMWDFARKRRYDVKRDAILLDDEESVVDARKMAESRAAQTPQTAERPEAPLYSPVNLGVQTEPATAASPAAGEGETTPSASENTPLPRAA